MITHDVPPTQETNNRLRAAAHDAAKALRPLPRRPRRNRELDHRSLQLLSTIEDAEGNADPARVRRYLEDRRLIRTAAREARDISSSLIGTPHVEGDGGRAMPRACVLAAQYLDAADNRFHEDALAAFLDSYQDVAELGMDEIWGLKPALQLELLERLAKSGSDWPALVDSLRHVGEAAWEDLFESVSRVERILDRDPAAAYSAMDSDSRDLYRGVVGEVAKNSRRSEREVAETAVELARQAARLRDGSRAAARRAHVGFYLVDRGIATLRGSLGYRGTRSERLRDTIVREGVTFYLAGVEAVTLAIVIFLLSRVDAWIPAFWGFLVLILPATQAAVDFINNLVAVIVPPRALPKLDFSEGIPDDCLTMVAVPTLLMKEPQVRDLVLDLEIRYLANRDRNLIFALLTDSPDSDRPVDERDALVGLCRELILGLNRRYGSAGRAPFYLLHRHRIFNPSENRWMGWERKRGKLLDLNQYLRGGFDSFGVKVGRLEDLPRVTYVITLDSDTQLPPGSAAKLIGAIAHPLNRAVLDPHSKVVVEGYGILQPRIGISIQSASRSRLAALYSGQTGFDIYTRAVSDVYQDLFGEGIFTGKGIYEVDALRETLEHRFPDNALLSHDLIEGTYARAALVSDIELIDDYPSHFSAYSRRKHRWVRGDWQIMRWLGPRVPDRRGNLIPNPIQIISRWKIFDNLRRSLLEPAFLLLLLAGWLVLPGDPGFWTAATLGMIFLPAWSNLLFSLIRMPWRARGWRAWADRTLENFAQANMATVLSVVFLLHQSLLSLDAIARSVLRVFVTRRKLLEWETAAEAETQVRSRATVDTYLEASPLVVAGLGIAIGLIRLKALPAALPMLLAWFLARGISDWLNRKPRSTDHILSEEDTQLLRDSAERMFRYFREWSTSQTHYLIPDNVQEDGTVAFRISPTNIGMLLNARVAGVHFGLMTLAEFTAETRRTLDTMARMETCRGHFLNWYDVETLAPLEPRFVSTVDSGNLAACLWTLKQAALEFAHAPAGERGLTRALAVELTAIAETCDAMVRDMDFAFLYKRRKKVLSVGYDAAARRLEPSSYDLLASESRIAVFVAVAKGDIPQEAWFRLGRAHVLAYGEAVLCSWTGTMFEYLMPSLWMRTYGGTILDRSARAVVKVQREHARRKGVPWGISESARAGKEEGDYGYAAFGIPALSMKQQPSALVISPYSTFLSLSVDPGAALKNLRRMQEFGWVGRYGFYEAIDYTREGANVIHSWMVHHQGMSLLAVCNLLFGDAIRKYFHAEPQVMASELLLHERVPAGTLDEAEAGVEAGSAAAPAA